LIQRQPHRVYAALWALRYLAMVFAIATGNIATGNRLVFTISAASFFPLEGVAVWQKSNGMRDTLSEIWTWVLRKLSKHDRPFTGWNWIAAIFASFEGSALYVIMDWVAWFPTLGAAGMSIALAAMLHAHWLKPQVHG
jgi:hypothetical protein